MTPRSKRRWLLKLAQAARARVEQTIDVLEDGRFSDEEVARTEPLVWETYQAIFGDEKTLRWLLFVRAVETKTSTLIHASDVAVARGVINAYGEIFPDIARDLDAAAVTTAVRAWRDDCNHFAAVRKALVSALPEAKVPTARSMATKWSAATTSAPWTAPSKRRPRRSGTAEQPRGVRLEDRHKRR